MSTQREVEKEIKRLERQVRTHRHKASRERKKASIASDYHYQKKHEREASRKESKLKKLKEKRKSEHEEEVQPKELTTEEKEELRQKQAKQHRESRMRALRNRLQTVNVSPEMEIPDDPNKIEGFPESPVTEENGEFRESEMALREEVNKLVEQYHIADKKIVSAKEEQKKNHMRRTSTGRHHSFPNTVSVPDLMWKRHRNNPKRIRRICSNYCKALKKKYVELERQKVRENIFESFDFTTISGVGPKTDEVLEEAKEEMLNSRIIQNGVKVRDRHPDIGELTDYLLNKDSTGTKIYERYQGVGPQTIERLSEVAEKVDNVVNKITLESLGLEDT